MNTTGLISADPAVVVAAGRDTAGTAELWEGWAGRCAEAFTEARRAVRDARIELAGSAFAARVVLAAGQVGQRVAALGDDTVAAGTTVAGADEEAAALLGRHAAGLPTALLRRPVNGVRTPV